jgi:hypothetical protein
VAAVPSGFSLTPEIIIIINNTRINHGADPMLLLPTVLRIVPVTAYRVGYATQSIIILNIVSVSPIDGSNNQLRTSRCYVSNIHSNLDPVVPNRGIWYSSLQMKFVSS